MTTDVQANGIECFECASITEDPDPEDNCERCGSDNVGPVEISECTIPPAADGRCSSDDHHYGLNKHVRTIER